MSTLAGLLMKAMRVDPTDSVSRRGDSITIENEDVTFFCKRPFVGRTWLQRPDWLLYEIEATDEIDVWQHVHPCYRIAATPLDSHFFADSSDNYEHTSWVTESAILRTTVSLTLPESTTGMTYHEIGLIEDIDRTDSLVTPSQYKQRVLGAYGR